MHLLLVDDEIHATERIRTMLEWETIGIHQVSVAHSMQQAIRVFEKSEVDIMLCDIEMPQGSGIELAEWVRGQGYQTAIIFLTCHAQFTYAKDAMRLRSQDYLLKPVDKETLKAALMRAVVVVRQRIRITKITQSEALWQNNRCNILEYFWLQVAQGSFSNSDKEIIQRAADRGISLAEDAKLYAILISLRDYDENWKNDDRRLIAYAQLNIARELFETEGTLNAVVELERGMLIAVCCPAEEGMRQELEEDAARYTDVCRGRLGLEVFCGISGMIAPSELNATVERMMKNELNKLVVHDHVWVDDISEPQSSLKPPDVELWSNMLQRGMCRQVREAVIAYFQDPAVEEGISPNFLRNFQQEVFQMIYDFCQQKEIAARGFLRDDVELQARALRSVPDMLIWVNKLIDRCEQAKTAESDNDPIQDVKRYIAEHLDQDISREDIARHVHLNPDYLSRIFKKEVGVSVIDYLIGRRIEMAKKLLQETNMRVSDVAAQVGYSNFSHFSKIFKKKVGVNPNQFKRK